MTELIFSVRLRIDAPKYDQTPVFQVKYFQFIKLEEFSRLVEKLLASSDNKKQLHGSSLPTHVLSSLLSFTLPWLCNCQCAGTHRRGRFCLCKQDMQNYWQVKRNRELMFSNVDSVVLIQIKYKGEKTLYCHCEHLKIAYWKCSGIRSPESNSTVFAYTFQRRTAF